MISGSAELGDRLQAEAGAAGANTFAHARDLATGAECGLGGELPVVLASVFKISIALELACQFEDGRLDPLDRVLVPAEGRTMGPTGLSALLDPVEISLRDLAQLMISVSDNTATDIILKHVGIDAVSATLRRLGLDETHIQFDCNSMLGRIVVDLKLSHAELANLTEGGDAGLVAVSPERWALCRDLHPQSTNRSTARDTTRLLELIWKDEAASPPACALVRRLMGQQVWPHRLRSGFPGLVRVSGKTGSLPFVRNEAGVVEYPDGGRYAVAVFTVASNPAAHLPDIDRSIGVIGRLMVEELRCRAGAPEATEL